MSKYLSIILTALIIVVIVMVIIITVQFGRVSGPAGQGTVAKKNPLYHQGNSQVYRGSRAGIVLGIIHWNL